MAQLPPFQVHSAGVPPPAPTRELMDGMASALARCVERYSDELGKHGCMLGEIPEVWETVARTAFVYIAAHAGAKSSPIREDPRGR